MAGIEPATSALSGLRSNRLSYTPGIPRGVPSRSRRAFPARDARLRPRGSGVAAFAPRDARREGWWRQPDSNRRPRACKARALPTELCPHNRLWQIAGAPSTFSPGIVHGSASNRRWSNRQRLIKTFHCTPLASAFLFAEPLHQSVPPARTDD